MARLRTISAGVLLLLGGALAQAQAPRATTRQLLMWKAVSGPNVVYLLGSIHVGSKDMYPLPRVITDAFDQSKVLVVEVDIDNIDMGSAMKFIQTKGMYTNGDTLWKHLSKATADKVKKFFEAYDTDPDTVGLFKPWLAEVYAETVPLTKAGFDPSLGIDKHFLDLAQGKKKIVQAESVQFQLDLLSSMPDNLADVYLSSSIGDLAHTKEDSQKLVNLWKAGDAEAINKAENDHPKELDGMMRKLIQDRNPHMADIAEKYLKGDGPCFFVVGTGHLVGPEGVVAILQKRGYSVTRVAQ